MVYVLNNTGEPLMPTERHGKVRRLLKQGKAKVINLCPFVIQLNYDSATNKQDIVLGVDAGSKHVGLSACSDHRELFSAEMQPRNDVTKKLSDRRELREHRKDRKTRYRKQRILNRVKSKHKGWLAPSVQVKIQEHITTIMHVLKILPITSIIIETAEFDMHKLKCLQNETSMPVGIGYQFGEMFNSYNVRQYVLKRDNYTCQCCKRKPNSKNEIKFHVHHIESRRVGGDAPDNLITLCSACHNALHSGNISLSKNIKRKQSTRDAAFMGLMRKSLISQLSKLTDIPVKETFGYVTKGIREAYGIQKSHINDARCIAGYSTSKQIKETYLIKPKRCHNRQLHRVKAMKGGIRKRNQAEYLVYGFRLWDKVRFKGTICFINSRRVNGCFELSHLDFSVVEKLAWYKKIKFIEPAKHYLVEMITIT